MIKKLRYHAIKHETIRGNNASAICIYHYFILLARKILGAEKHKKLFALRTQLIFYLANIMMLRLH